MVIPENIQDLIVAQLAGEISPDERRLLKEWIEVDKEHQEVYKQYCGVWYGGVIGKRKNMQRQNGWAIIVKKHQERKQKLIIRWIIAIAACCILFIGSYRMYSYLHPRVEETRSMAVADLLEKRKIENVRLVLSTGREISLDGVVTEHEEGVAIYSDSTGLKYSPANETLLGKPIYNELFIPKCGEYQLVLADGTKVMLNSESTLRYPVNFSGDSREVWLSGEAYFDVVRNEKLPFIVHVDHAAIKVLGTSFNVLAYKDEVNTEITLVQGKVEVGTSMQKELLLPGNQIRVDHMTSRMESRKVDVTQYTAWKEGVLRFDDMPLGQLMSRLSRWYDIVFEFRQEELKERLFSGGFRKYEQLERVLEMIQAINDVKFSVENNKIIIDKK